MTAIARLRRAVLLGSLWLAAVPAQQRTLVPITSTTEDHLAAVLSPNGQWVAFRGPSKIAVVPYAGGNEVVLATGTNLGGFLWTPDSRGIYFLDGAQLSFIGTGGGLSTPIYALPEASHQLWDVTRNDRELFGTWLYVRNNGGTTVRESQVFVIRTDGSQAPRVIVQSVLTVDGVHVSPDGLHIAYRQYDPTPFTLRDFFVANIDGTNPVSLTGGVGFGLDPGVPLWDPNNAGIYFWRTDRAIAKPVIERFSFTSTVRVPFTFTTPARNPSISADGRWIVYEGYSAMAQTWTPVAMPVGGGGHVFLDTTRTLAFSGTPMLGGPGGDQVIVSGNLAGASFAQVHKCELARELLVRPRAEVGTAVTLELPVNAGDSGVVVLSAAPIATPFSLPGFAGGFQLDPTTLVTVLTGVGQGPPLTTQIPIPNVNFLRRKAAYLQALRLTTLSQGDFTRFVELPVF